MNIHHIFIITDDNGKIADELLAFGFSEGSSRIHVGQGTTNRKFYFENFFLEILWVHNANEITSDKIKPMGLWQRTNYNTNNFSPFGLCLVNSDETETIFKDAFRFQPEYFPPGNEIDIIKNEDQSDLPWTFRLPFKGNNKPANEPTNHINGISELTNATFEFRTISDSSFLENFKNEEQIRFLESYRYWLNLSFDNEMQGKQKIFESLKLTIKY